ncbi:hypothetical protein LPJ66_006729, partial [Kickxella alabastrina]
MSSSASNSSPRLPLYKRLFKRTASKTSDAVDETGVRMAASNLPPRKIYTNMDIPEDDVSKHAEHFSTNAITTSQYTLIDFLPKNLSRQFGRVANIYFLTLTILQMISYFAVGSRFLAIVPIILVLAITAIKDAFEDWRRHISDKQFNNTPTRLVRNLRNFNTVWQDKQAEVAKSSRLLAWRIRLARRMKRKTWYNQIPHDWEESRNPVDPSKPPVLDEESKWRNVRVGDFIILKTGDPAPSDMLLLATSADDGGCYVETKNLDGETNLKPRASLAETAGVRDAEGCGRLRALIEVDPPSSNMSKLNGSIRIFSMPMAPEGDNSTPSDSLGAGVDRYLQNPSSPPPFNSIGGAPPGMGHRRQMSSIGSPLGDNNFEMRMLGPKQTAPFRQSPLAQLKPKPALVSHFNADDQPSFDPSQAMAMETLEPKLVSEGVTTTTSDNVIVLGKSLPNDVNYGSDPLVAPFSISNVVLRGMTVRNTDWIVGIVLYTGDQTKIVLNSGPPPYKRSRIERTMNVQVSMSFGFVFVTSFIVALVGGLKYANPDQRYSMYVDTTMEKGLYGFALFWSAMIMLQNIIPIALYVSIEFVKGWHAYWIYQDINMYYEPTDQRCIANNWNISDDLGQVSYIFSDKTGTLTRNVMDFRMCSINGTIYGRQLPGDELDVVKGRIAQEEVDRNNPPEGGANPFFMEIQDDDSDEGNFGRARISTNTSIGSTGTNQYEHSPLISTADASLGRFDVTRTPPAPIPAPIAANRSRARTIQQLTEEEAQSKSKQMIASYLTAMRNVFDPKYVEIGDETTGEGGAYTFVDPQLFYDMKPEVAPVGRVRAVDINNETGMPIAPHMVRRVGSHRSISNGFDVDPLRQRDMVDLFLTELATCHSVVVEKNFQKHIINNDDDDKSTIRRLTRILHNRTGSKRITDMVRHKRHRSKHHGRTDSVATNASNIEGLEWAPSSEGRPVSPSMAAHQHTASSVSATDNHMSLTMPVRGSNLQTIDRSYASLADSTNSPASANFNMGTLSEEPEINGSFSRSASGSGAESPPAQDMSKLAYSAESPDEGALVRAAKNFGYTFLGRVKNTIYLDIRGQRTQYEVLDTIDFNSTRKRMTSIMRRPAPHNDIILFSKGADNVMIERLSKLPSSSEPPAPFESRDEINFERIMRERTFNQIDEFANAGLRTLVLCYRKLSENEWVKWSARYHTALGSVESDREEQIAIICEEMERDLRIVGATAIEDKLQELVPDTIASLRAAGIKIWVLTGDKMETAINIGFAANLLTKDMELWTINSSSGTDKILSRFKLIGRIMLGTAANNVGQDTAAGSKGATAAKMSRTSNVNLDSEDARVLGSVSYKIGRAKKFLHIGNTLRMKSHQRQRGNLNSDRSNPAPKALIEDNPEFSSLDPSPEAANASDMTETRGGGRHAAFPQIQDEDISPDEVRQSIEYLRRNSTFNEEGQALGADSDTKAAYQPLNALVID